MCYRCIVKAALRVRMQDRDARRPGGLVDSARIMELFGEAAAELSRRVFAREGQVRAYETVEFVAPAYSGDVLEVEAEAISSSPSAVMIRLEVRKAGESWPEGRAPLVAHARGTWIAAPQR
jgi:acyl-CoA thioesterase FadM